MGEPPCPGTELFEGVVHVQPFTDRVKEGVFEGIPKKYLILVAIEATDTGSFIYAYRHVLVQNPQQHLEHQAALNYNRYRIPVNMMTVMATYKLLKSEFT